jgi:hypothetical protein
MGNVIMNKRGGSTKKPAVAPVAKMKHGGACGTGGMKSPNGVAKGMKFVNQ